MLTQKRLREVLRYDRKTGVFYWRESHQGVHRKKALTAGCVSGKYVRIRVDGTLYHAHRLAWLYVHGAWPSLHLDHERGHTNKFSNLRHCTPSQNLANASLRSDNTSGFKGVVRSLGSSTWRAQIRAEHIGSYPTAKQAAKAYDNAALRLYGRFALTNRKMGLL